MEFYAVFQYTGVVLWIVRYNGAMDANTDALVFVILIIILIIIISIHWSTHGHDSMVPGGCRGICNIDSSFNYNFDPVNLNHCYLSFDQGYFIGSIKF